MQQVRQKARAASSAARRPWDEAVGRAQPAAAWLQRPAPRLTPLSRRARLHQVQLRRRGAGQRSERTRGPQASATPPARGRAAPSGPRRASRRAAELQPAPSEVGGAAGSGGGGQRRRGCACSGSRGGAAHQRCTAASARPRARVSSLLKHHSTPAGAQPAARAQRRPARPPLASAALRRAARQARPAAGYQLSAPSVDEPHAPPGRSHGCVETRAPRGGEDVCSPESAERALTLTPARSTACE